LESLKDVPLNHNENFPKLETRNSGLYYRKNGLRLVGYR
jgi:hypothetical protein